MTRRIPLPSSIVGRAFSTREALSLGASAKQLRASDLTAPFHGARLPASADTLRDRCMALQSVTNRTTFVSHSTAARLYGVPLPRRLEQESTLHVTVERPNRAPQRPGVIGHSCASGTEGEAWLDSRGLRIARATRVWLDLACQLDLTELVIAGDYLLRGLRERDGTRTPFVTIAQLRQAAHHNGDRRRRALVARALGLVRERVDSPYETRLRLIIWSAGFPDPVVNEPILDARGDTIAQPDLRIPGFMVGVEYQGDGHRTDRRQWQRDVVRRRELDAIRWKTLEAVVPDVRNPAHLLHALESELRERGWAGIRRPPTLGVGG